jgi:RNase P/RNase MRP subunit p30
MFDIIRCDADPSAFGFSRFYNVSACKGKVAECQDLAAALAYRNRKALVLLRDYAFDEGAIRLIADKKSACFLIDLGALMRVRGVPRAIAISKLRNFLRLCVKHGALYSFASFAERESQIRTPAELESIAMLLGINRGQAKLALRMLPHYL